MSLVRRERHTEVSRSGVFSGKVGFHVEELSNRDVVSLNMLAFTTQALSQADRTDRLDRYTSLCDCNYLRQSLHPSHVHGASSKSVASEMHSWGFVARVV